LNAGQCINTIPLAFIVTFSFILTFTPEICNWNECSSFGPFFKEREREKKRRAKLHCAIITL